LGDNKTASIFKVATPVLTINAHAGENYPERSLAKNIRHRPEHHIS
jgi:hypothetical protein